MRSYKSFKTDCSSSHCYTSRFETKSLTVLYVRIKNVTSSLCTCVCMEEEGWEGGVKQKHVLRSTCKAFKGETRSYCLSARLTLWRIARTVLCCAVHDQSAELFGGRSKKRKKEEKKRSVTMLIPVPTGDRTAV